jgi:hypothetical protein
MLATGLHRTIYWVLLTALWAVPAAGAGGVVLSQPGDAATSRPVQAAEESTEPVIDEGSRGVARHLLLAGFAAAAVVAVLSGVFALGKKRHPQTSGGK